MTLKPEERQPAMEAWARRVIGEGAWIPEERALRVAEEALELAQALNVNNIDLHRLVDYVYARPVGEPGQEVAGIFVTLYAAAACIGVDAEAEFEKEFIRIHTPEIEEKVRRRQAEKRANLVAAADPSVFTERPKKTAPPPPSDTEWRDSLPKCHWGTACGKIGTKWVGRQVLYCDKHGAIYLPDAPWAELVRKYGL